VAAKDSFFPALMPNILLVAAVKNIFVPGTRSHFLKLLGASNHDYDFFVLQFCFKSEFCPFLQFFNKQNCQDLHEFKIVC
jgi:hypothetical protein